MAELVDHYRTAPRGAQTSSPHQQEILEEFIRLAIGARRIPSVLDLGSGRGSNVATLAAHVDRVVIADVSAEALRDSMRVHSGLRGRLDPVVLPGAGLPFRDGAFGLTVCTEVLEHVEDPAFTAAELQRVTARGGHLVVSTPNYRNVMGLVKLWKDWRSGRHDFDPWHAHAGGYEGFMTAPRLRSIFSGCRILETRGADYAFALGIMWGPLRWRLSRYLLIRPGRVRSLAQFGMQYYLLLERR
ncbi:MAG: class I SAM-dependent methyltransferase [Acidimicrobiales bacterium]